MPLIFNTRLLASHPTKSQMISGTERQSHLHTYNHLAASSTLVDITTYPGLRPVTLKAYWWVISLVPPCIEYGTSGYSRSSRQETSIFRTPKNNQQQNKLVRCTQYPSNDAIFTGKNQWYQHSTPPKRPPQTKSAQNHLQTLPHLEINLSVTDTVKSTESSHWTQTSRINYVPVCRSRSPQFIPSQIRSEELEFKEEFLLTANSASLNGLISTALYLAMTTFAATQTYLQARHPSEWTDWSTAMANRLAKMDKYTCGMWPKMRDAGARWLYTRKIGESTGLPSTYKTRWVAKGCFQVEGIDYNKLYAAVAHKDTNEVFLSLVNHFPGMQPSGHCCRLPQWWSARLSSHGPSWKIQSI